MIELDGPEEHPAQKRLFKVFQMLDTNLNFKNILTLQ